MNGQKIISVCCTSHNRRDMTLRCLSSLYNQDAVKNGEVILKIFLCDDGSTDGTANAIQDQFPEVNIISGDGKLFWAKGMNLAFSEAKGHKTDFFLMVNDDVNFNRDMLDLLLMAYQSVCKQNKAVAVVGSIKDPVTGEWSYGGKNWNKKWFKDVKSTVFPVRPYAKCELANWNCFLLPHNLAQKVGDIESAYAHAMADYDYSIRILKMGGEIITAGDYVGTCSRNETKGTWQDLSLPLSQRYKLLHKNTARPMKSYIHYCKVAYGNTWLYWFLLQYIWIAKTSFIYRLRESKNEGK